MTIRTNRALLDSIDHAAADGNLTQDSAVNLKRWLTETCYAEYHEKLEGLIEAGDWDQLDALFWEVIDFGTGGRRGRMADLGSATINPRTIAESAHGLAVYLRGVRGERGGRAAVAHDTRIMSPEFARLTATTLAAHGLTVFFFDSHRATPELSFAVRRLNCDVGVMISASHNPPSDNGFKAYWSGGEQVLDPHDRRIINCVYEATDIPTVDFDQAVANGRIELIGEQIDAQYVGEVVRLSLSNARAIRAVYTPLHGVGETSVYRVIREAGFRNVEIFEAHREPDGHFPNVPDQLPNPERPQVFDPVIRHIEQTGADIDLILGSDPDADRTGLVVRDSGGRFTYLTGNRIGALLTDYVIRKHAQRGSLNVDSFVVETIVTTPLVADIASRHGVQAVTDLLVGFKYIARAVEQGGPESFLFGAEESIGYLAGQYCRDKDAAIAALYALELAAELKGQGKTLLDRLDELFVEHAYYAEMQLSKSFHGPSGRSCIDAIMSACAKRRRGN